MTVVQHPRALTAQTVRRLLHPERSPLPLHQIIWARAGDSFQIEPAYCDFHEWSRALASKAPELTSYIGERYMLPASHVPSVTKSILDFVTDGVRAKVVDKAAVLALLKDAIQHLEAL